MNCKEHKNKEEGRKLSLFYRDLSFINILICNIDRTI